LKHSATLASKKNYQKYKTAKAKVLPVSSFSSLTGCNVNIYLHLQNLTSLSHQPRNLHKAFIKSINLSGLSAQS